MQYILRSLKFETPEVPKTEILKSRLLDAFGVFFYFV